MGIVTGAVETDTGRLRATRGPCKEPWAPIETMEECSSENEVTLTKTYGKHVCGRCAQCSELKGGEECKKGVKCIVSTHKCCDGKTYATRGFQCTDDSSLDQWVVGAASMCAPCEEPEPESDVPATKSLHWQH